jgi:hypothetical protein
VSDASKELPGTKMLDYVALGLLLAPPAVVFEMFVKGDSLNWTRTAVATAICWTMGGIVVLASHRWQSWRSRTKSLLPYLSAMEGRFWGKAIIVACSIGLALALSTFLGEGQKSSETQFAEQRIIVPPSVTPAYLISLYKNVSLSAQGDKLLEPFIGTWMKVSQTVADVKANGIWTYLKEDDGGIRTIVLVFDPIWINRLSILTRGQTITALCQITPAVNVTTMVLQHCELESGK